MDNTPEVLFQNAHYHACVLKDGSLVAQKKSTGKGYRLIGEDAPIWADFIRTAVDRSEASALCRAMCS